MTRFGIDAGVALRMVEENLVLAEGHTLVAPNRLRSDALSTLFRSVKLGERDEATARRMLDGITTLRIRLLCDRVSRAHAWRIAEQLGWVDTAGAEYVAVATLQADAFVTLDADLARAVEGIVPIAPFEALLHS
jgi:predicted nucleic acid-binding protein